MSAEMGAAPAGIVHRQRNVEFAAMMASRRAIDDETMARACRAVLDSDDHKKLVAFVQLCAIVCKPRAK